MGPSARRAEAVLDEVTSGELATGDRVGAYELLYPVARGNLATLWSARKRGPRGFQQTVALKLLLTSLRRDAEARSLVLDLARAASRLEHPNVVQVIDVGEADGSPYVASEWVDGEPLSKILAAVKTAGGRLPLEFCLRVTAAACAGLHAAHELVDDRGARVGLIHRDVSPTNVLVTFSGLVKVVDFGVMKAKSRASTRALGSLKGTIAFLAPEQLSGGSVDRRTDVFALGCVLYLMLTNEAPFGDLMNDTFDSIMSDPPDRPSRIARGLPEAVDELVLKCLAKEPDDRFQSAEDMMRAVEQLAAKLGATAGDEEVASVLRSALPGLEDARRERLARAMREADARADAPTRGPRSRPPPEPTPPPARRTSGVEAPPTPAPIRTKDAGGRRATPSGRKATPKLATRAVRPPDEATAEPAAASTGESAAPACEPASLGVATAPREAAPSRRNVLAGFGAATVLGGLLAVATMSGSPRAQSAKGGLGAFDRPARALRAAQEAPLAAPSALAAATTAAPGIDEGPAAPDDALPSPAPAKAAPSPPETTAASPRPKAARPATPKKPAKRKDSFQPQGI